MKIVSWFLATVITLSLAMSVSANPKKIGYIVNYGTHEWYQNVIFGLQSRADELGIDFEVMDANLDINKQTQQAEDFMTKGVDVLIMTPVNEEGVVPILRKAKADGTPVVLEGNPAKGMTTLESTEGSMQASNNFLVSLIGFCVGCLMPSSILFCFACLLV